MSVWPFIPRDDFIETLEWKTDVIRTYSAEQRIRLSDFPRQRFNLTHVLSPRQYQRAKLLMFNAAAGDWDLPVWAEKQTVSVSASATTITIDTATSDYRVGGKAIVWSDDETYETVTISADNGTNLTVSALSATYTNALCMPVRTARCVDGLSASRTVEQYTECGAEWVVYTGVDLSDDGLYSTYRSHPVCNTPAILGTSTLEERVSRIQDSVDNGMSAPYFDTASSRADVSLGVSWLRQSQSTLWSLRTFLHALYGRQKGFWLPAYTRGMTLAANVSSADTTITVQAVGLDGVLEAGDVMIQQRDGTQTFLQFTSVATSGANEVLTLSGAAGVNITKTNAQTVCLLHFVRLSQDSVQITHTNGIGAQIMVACDEVPIP